MNFTGLVPSVFYKNLNDGIQLFADCLEFTIVHKDLHTSQPYAVMKKGNLGIMIFEDEQLAAEHYPELRLVTDNIDEVYAKVSSSHPQWLHPNLNVVTKRSWGAREFAVADGQVGIRFQQW